MVTTFIIGMLLALLLVACTPAGPEGAAQNPTREPTSTETTEPTDAQIDTIENLLAGTEWVLVSLDGTPVSDGLTLEFSANTLSGADGCNSFSASYLMAEGALALETDSFAVTERACLDEDVMELAQQYTVALLTAGEFTLDNDRLTVMTESGELVFAQAEAGDTAIGDSDWSLLYTVVGGDAEVPVPDSANPYFTVTDGRVSGNSGCNSFRGPVTLDGNKIDFGPLVTTRMACEAERMALEEAVLDILEKAATFTLTDNTLELQDADGLPLARFAEAEQKTLYVGSEKVDCVGVGPQECLLVKEDPNAEYEFFYDSIGGFEWEAGYAYELLVSVTEVAQPPADASSLQYKLVELVSKEPVAANPLAGTVWQWVRFEDMADLNNIEVENPADYTIEFMPDGTYAIQADCNSGSGAYTLEGSTVSIEPGPMTLMECGEGSLAGEFTRLLGDVATYVLAEDGTLFLNVKFDSGNMVFSAAG